MDDYICPTCGYPRSKKKAGGKGQLSHVKNREDLPEDWTCPGCGIDKNGFIKLQLEFNKK